jgi:hypothetical protein
MWVRGIYLSGNPPLLPDELRQALRQAKYQLVGRHAAAKKYRWLHKGLLKEGPYYKHQFYGV